MTDITLTNLAKADQEILIGSNKQASLSLGFLLMQD